VEKHWVEAPYVGGGRGNPRSANPRVRFASWEARVHKMFFAHEEYLIKEVLIVFIENKHVYMFFKFLLGWLQIGKSAMNTNLYMVQTRYSLLFFSVFETLFLNTMTD
jgi:hypothetical protein